MRIGLPKRVGGQVSVWLSLAAAFVLAVVVTWYYLGVATLAGQKPSILAVFGWMFWMLVLGVVFIWACWVKTGKGWRWRWRQ